MKPYYEHAGITIYHGDCREILPQLPKVDLVLTDPPYGIGMDYSKKRTKPSRPNSYKYYQDKHITSAWDKSRIDENTMLMIFRAGKNQILFGANYYCNMLPDGFGWIFWNKLNGINNCFSDGEFAFCSKGVQSRYFECSPFVGLCGGLNREHPTQKPVKLFKWCIELFSEAQTILDPFMGSGTTLRAAKDLNRKAIGIEIEEKYCEIAAERMSQEVLQLNQDARFSDTGEHLTTGASTPLVGN